MHLMTDISFCLIWKPIEEQSGIILVRLYKAVQYEKTGKNTAPFIGALIVFQNELTFFCCNRLLKFRIFVFCVSCFCQIRLCVSLFRLTP